MSVQNNYFRAGYVSLTDDMSTFAKDKLSEKDNDSIQLGKTNVALSNSARRDLTRYGELKINGDEVYNVRNKIWNKSAKEHEVLEKINNTTKNWKETTQYIKLLHQDINHLANQELTDKYNLKGEKIFTVVEKSYNLEVEKDKFKVTAEMIAKYKDMKEIYDEESPLHSYVKVKTVVSGKRESLLDEKKYGEVRTEVIHSAEFGKEIEARSAPYPKNLQETFVKIENEDYD